MRDTNRTIGNFSPVMLEALESRQLMSAGTPSLASVLPGEHELTLGLRFVDVRLTDEGVLRITGSEFGDRVTVNHRNGVLTVVADGVTSKFATADVKRINANLGGGDDHFNPRGDFDLPMNIKGNEGNDQLAGGNADDRIDGGTGEDDLYGDGGHDVLIGGRDSDVINAFDGRTIIPLIGPSTSFGGTPDEVFADDGSKDVIIHDSTDTIHKDSRDQANDVTSKQPKLPKILPATEGVLDLR